MSEASYDEKVLSSVELLTQGVSVELSGLPGSGRSRALREICDRLVNVGVQVVRLPGISMPSPLPLGPFIGLGQDSTKPRNLGAPHGVAAQLEEALKRERSVLVIDDLAALDDVSVSAILTARHSTHTPILATNRPETAGKNSSLFSHLSPSLRIPMKPLRHDEIDQLLRNRLQLALEPSALGVIINACGGLPGLTLFTTETLLRRGILRNVGPGWRMVGTLWSTELSAIVEQYLAPLDDESRMAMHMLAVAGTMTVEQAKLTHVSHKYKVLESAGLVHVLDVRGTQELAVYPPLLTEYFTHEVSELAGGEVAELLKEIPGIVARSNLAFLGPSPSSGWETTLLSHRVRVHWADEVVFRRVAWLGDPSPWTAMRYLVALANVSSDIQQLTDVVAATPLSGSERDQALFQMWWACHLAIVQHQPQAAIDLLHQGRSLAPQFAGAMRAIEAHVELVTRQVPPPTLLADASPDEDAASRDFLRTARAEILVAQGLQRQALEILEGPAESNVGTVLVEDVTRGIAILLGGDLEAATAWAAEHFQSSRAALDDSWSEGHAYLTAISLAMAGHLDAFDAHMTTVTSLASKGGINVHFLAATFAFASVIATERGQKETAIAYAEQALSFDVSATIYPGVPARMAHALATQDRESAGEIAWEITEHRIAVGHSTSAVMVGMIALEYDPDPAHAQIVTDVAMATESPLLQRVAQYAIAIADSSPEGLRAVSQELAKDGLVLYATRAAVRAAHEFQAAGDSAAAAAMAAEIWNALSPTDSGLIQLLRPLVKETGLTEREKEIAGLVAAGATTQIIADELVLSIRTVEQHILRACRKVGVSRRADLAKIAQTWLSPFVPGRPGS